MLEWLAGFILERIIDNSIQKRKENIQKRKEEPIVRARRDKYYQYDWESLLDDESSKSYSMVINDIHDYLYYSLYAIEKKHNIKPQNIYFKIATSMDELDKPLNK